MPHRKLILHGADVKPHARRTLETKTRTVSVPLRSRIHSVQSRSSYPSLHSSHLAELDSNRHSLIAAHGRVCHCYEQASRCQIARSTKRRRDEEIEVVGRAMVGGHGDITCVLVNWTTVR